MKKEKNTIKVKRKKNKKNHRKFKIIMMIVILLILAIIVALLNLDIFNIKNIVIKGNEKISEKEILKTLDIGENTNLFRETNLKIRGKLKNNYIENIQIRRKLPNTLEIKIIEKQIKYILKDKKDEQYIYITKKGEYLETNKIKLNYIVISKYKTDLKMLKERKKLNNEDLEQLRIIGSIEKYFDQINKISKITEIDILQKDDIVLFLEQEKKYIHIGNEKNLDIKLLYIKEIIERNKNVSGDIFVNMDLNKKKPYFREKI